MKPCALEDRAGVPFFVCSLCSPDLELDNASMVLFNLECPKHGRTWHRKMVRQADGSVTLAHELVRSPEAQPIGAGKTVW
jgi:hypothetical protein